MKINFAICDDNRIDSQYVNELIKKWAKNKKYQIHIDIFNLLKPFFFIIPKIKNMIFYY